MSMKRVVFINAHWNTLIMKTPMTFLFNIKPPQKYSILFNELIKKPDVQVCSFVTSEGSSIPRSVRFPFKNLVACFESWYTFRKNGFTNNDIITLTKISEIRPDDIVLAFVHTRGGSDKLNIINARKYLHLNQYWGHSIEELNKSLPYAQDYLLEANTAKEGNFLLRTNLAIGYRFHILPFFVSERFVCKKSFNIRKKKAIATGTLAKFQAECDCSRHYGTPYMHKMRKILFDNKDSINEYIDVLISPYVETNNTKVEKHYKGLLGVLYSFYKLRFLKLGAQKNYFSFNIVEKYNEYQMAVVPEEIVDVPAIGAFEAMSCGCAFIGVDHSMYRDLGMIPDIHYISYDGSLDNLKDKIVYYQKHQDELQIIAAAGYEFANKTLCKENILDLFCKIVGI